MAGSQLLWSVPARYAGRQQRRGPTALQMLLQCAMHAWPWAGCDRPRPQPWQEHEQVHERHCRRGLQRAVQEQLGQAGKQAFLIPQAGLATQRGIEPAQQCLLTSMLFMRSALLATSCCAALTWPSNMRLHAHAAPACMHACMHEGRCPSKAPAGWSIQLQPVVVQGLHLLQLADLTQLARPART